MLPDLGGFPWLSCKQTWRRSGLTSPRFVQARSCIKKKIKFKIIDEQSKGLHEY